MAWDFQHFEISAEKISFRRFFHEKIRFDWLDFERESEGTEKIAIRNHRRGERVTSDLTAELVFNPGKVLDVIDVSMCQ